MAKARHRSEAMMARTELSGKIGSRGVWRKPYSAISWIMWKSSGRPNSGKRSFFVGMLPVAVSKYSTRTVRYSRQQSMVCHQWGKVKALTKK